MHCNIIPVKSLINSKKRLNSFLSQEQRKALVLTLLKNVLTATTNSRLTHCTLLVTPDSEIVKIAQRWQFPRLKYLIEPEETGINPAVKLAIKWCLSKQISSILILPADLPLIKSKDIDEIIELGQKKSSIIIVPSRRKDGTNAFYQQPPNLMEVWYGDDSFHKNLDLISKQQLPHISLESPAFALDIDLKEDLLDLRKLMDLLKP
jgi:2-phospho-L-lactate/phosphoenolpyruvate guanylyltransferase